VCFALLQYHVAAEYAPLPAIWLLMASCRIGIAKYQGANRVAGFELHLGRTAHLEAGNEEWRRWKRSMRAITWEEAIRAWRVVQPTLYRRIYRTEHDLPSGTFSRRFANLHLGKPLYTMRPSIRRFVDNYVSGYKPDVAARETNDPYPWFLPAVLSGFATLPPERMFPRPDPEDVRGCTAGRRGNTGIRVAYFSGSYLSAKFTILNVAQVMLTIPLLISSIRYISASGLANLVLTGSNLSYSTDLWLALGDTLLLGAIWTYIAVRAAYHRRRELIIEDELMSVHSCAIVWQAVVIAHYRALEATANNHHRHYTEQLAKEAAEIAAWPFHIHEWIAGTTRSAPPLGRPAVGTQPLRLV
jgi:hypothetical protein